MKKVIVVYIIQIISIFAMLVSLLFLISGIVKEESYVLVSFIGLISSLCTLGFSYIMEAACLYIEKAEREKERAIEEPE